MPESELTQILAKEPAYAISHYQLKAGANLKGGRGFVGEAYLARPFILAMAALGEEYVTLRAGEETPVPVSVPDLPGNADVKTITARLRVAEVESPPQAETTTVGIQKEGETTSEAEGTYHLKVDMPTRPRNVAIKLEQGDIFWTFAGTLVNDSYALPDFSAQANAYLDKLKPAGNQLTLKFLVKSDTPGKVKIEITAKTLTRLQTQTWKNPLDDTIRIDRNLQLDFGMIAKISLDDILDQNKNRFSPKQIKLDIGGEISPERVFGNVDEHGGNEFATISQDYSLAQSFRLDTALHCVGVSGFFQTEGQTELYIELQNDENGTPAAGSPLTKSNLTLTPPEENEPTAWTYAAFENPVDLSVDTRYWIVVKAARGRTKVGLQSRTEDYLQTALVNRGGRLWKSQGQTSHPVLLFGLDPTLQKDLDSGRISNRLYEAFEKSGISLPVNAIISIKGEDRQWRISNNDKETYIVQKETDKLNLYDATIAALLRLVYLPENDNQTAGVEMGVAGTSRWQRVDPAPAAQTISFDLNGKSVKQTAIIIKSHTRGALSLANVMQEY